MAWFETGSGVGKVLEETVLWTNSSPTSSLAAGNKTLSESVDNFDKILIQYRLSTSISDGSYVIFDVDEYKQYVLAGNNAAGGIAYRYSSGTYVRTIYYTDATTIYFGTGYKLATSDTANGTCIPTRVLGIKYVDGVDENVLNVLSTNPDIKQGLTINASATKTITVTQKPRLILAFLTATSSNVSIGYGYSVTIDVKNNKNYYFGRNSSLDVIGAQGNLGITASDTKITIANGSTTVNRYYTVVAWY